MAPAVHPRRRGSRGHGAHVPFPADELAAAVDVNAARKAFDLDLPTLGPYAVDFTPNGRDLLSAVAKARRHGALGDYKLVTEVQLKETTRDVKFLHSGQFFAAAQKKYAYIYDNRGVEIHCLKEHVEVAKLDFLPALFLLTSVGEQGILRYQDTSYGKIVAQFRTKLGPCDAMTHNPQNAITHLGHGNGVVTLWSPNMGTPSVKMLTHRGPVRSVAVDPHGRYMATAGADAQVKIWDLRTYKEVHAYFAAVPAVKCGHLAARHARGVLRGPGCRFGTTSAVRGAKATAPYLTHHFRRGQIVSDFGFCPYDDALGVGHSGGFSNLMVPGSGEPNYDSMVANPFETKGQRREHGGGAVARQAGRRR